MNAARHKTKLLLADGSSLSRSALKPLVDTAYALCESDNGIDTLAFYSSFQPDILLLGTSLIDVDGLSIIREIRNSYHDQDTYILVLTEEEDPAQQALILSTGANDFLIKPFSKEEFLARLGVAERQTALTRQLREYNNRIKQEIELVASLQQKLLPSASPLITGVRIESIYRPSGQASGDYFDYFSLPDTNTLRVVIADVSGHGARAAFIMGIVRTLFRLTQFRPMPLSEIVTLINNHLLDIIGTEEDFVTLFCADLCFSTHSIEYINAGHCPGMLRDAHGRTERLNPNSPLLGFFAIRPEVQHSTFSEGSKVFLFTDGFFDWRMDNGKLFTLPMFWDYAASHMDCSRNYVDILLRGLADIAGDDTHFTDDVTALWIATGDEHA